MENLLSALKASHDPIIRSNNALGSPLYSRSSLSMHAMMASTYGW